MNQINQPESVDGLLRLVVWYYSSRQITMDELSEFMKSIDIKDPDPEHVMEIYRRYSDSVHDTGLELAKRMHM